MMLICSPNPSVWGQAVTCTATLPANATGPVSFSDGGTSLGTGNVLDEHATFTTTLLAVTTHPIAAAYGGDINYNGAVAPPVSQVVGKAILSVVANPQQKVYGQPNPALTSTISGFVNSDTSAVVTGAPVLTTAATTTSPPGEYPITTAVGTLAATNYNFVAADGILVVAAAAATVTITTSAPSIPMRTPVTFTATVPAGATGTVQFYDGTTPIGNPVPISNGIATLTTSTLAQGTHPVTAVYSGDSNYNGASSAVLSQVVLSPADFAVAATPASQIIPPGASTNYSISVTSVTAPFTNLVALTATGLPTGATYSFSPAGVTPGTAGATSSLTVTVPKQTAAASRMRGIAPIALATLLLPWMWVKRKTSGPPRLLMWLLLSLATLGSVMGCGVGGYFSQPQQTYTITITGTSGSLMHSTTVTLTVE